MLNRNWGRIVLIFSETGLNISPDMIHYGIGKAAEIALGGLVELTAGTGVTVNTVLPDQRHRVASPTFSKPMPVRTTTPIATWQAAAPDDTAAPRCDRRGVRQRGHVCRFPEILQANGATLRAEGGIL